MPPSQQGTPCKRKDIAKAFFDLDISDSRPLTASKTPKPRDRNPPIASKPLVNTAKGDNKVILLILPVELRLRIYDLLLGSRFNPEDNPSRSRKHEANPILYSRNVFAISEPKQMFRLIAQIGLVNLKLIKTLHIWVPYMAELSPWLQLLRILAEEAGAMRCMELGWGARCEFPWQFRQGATERGLGDNLDFVRALGRIQGLEKLVISGYYAKNWPAYLEERMHVWVQAICGHCREEDELKKGNLNAEELAEELRSQKLDREINERELQDFMEYQRGTEDLFP
ncbi:hypothetical protein LAWI1_G002175 [Lachnellula willkommii]|uniref:Uncharacterized protein n=1 Tax=Lachnellula willkommii TaxID=215461 RepID=A0A559MFP6_9HELO|nr:hypothetical protein LAWI1_G002175 [Lachnellula willkommii]